MKKLFPFAKQRHTLTANCQAICPNDLAVLFSHMNEIYVQQDMPYILLSLQLYISLKLLSVKKTVICICKNKSTDNRLKVSISITAQLISFETQIVQFLFYLNPSFIVQAVFVGPVQKPHCWFSHEAAHFLFPLQVLQAAG